MTNETKPMSQDCTRGSREAEKTPQSLSLIRSEKSPLLWMAVLCVYESTVASLGPDAKLNGCCSFLNSREKLTEPEKQVEIRI